jgi:hypothetical protein
MGRVYVRWRGREKERERERERERETTSNQLFECHARTDKFNATIKLREKEREKEREGIVFSVR